MDAGQPQGGDDVAYFQQQAARNERERRVIARWSLYGVPVSLALFYFDWRATVAGLGLCFMFYSMGMYMTWVRRGEFAEGLAEAKAQKRVS